MFFMSQLQSPAHTRALKPPLAAASAIFGRLDGTVRCRYYVYSARSSATLNSRNMLSTNPTIYPPRHFSLQPTSRYTANHQVSGSSFHNAYSNSVYKKHQCYLSKHPPSLNNYLTHQAPRFQYANLTTPVHPPIRSIYRILAPS